MRPSTQGQARFHKILISGDTSTRELNWTPKRPIFASDWSVCEHVGAGDGDGPPGLRVFALSGEESLTIG